MVSSDLKWVSEPQVSQFAVSFGSLLANFLFPFETAIKTLLTRVVCESFHFSFVATTMAFTKTLLQQPLSRTFCDERGKPLVA